VDFHPFIRKRENMMSPIPSLMPSGRINTYMSKAREENLCRNIGRTRKMQSLIRGGKDSNLPSIGMSLIEIIKISMLRGISRKKIPWEKGKDHQSNAGDARKIICTRISHTKRIE
jgi:hypothetical protein